MRRWFRASRPGQRVEPVPQPEQPAPPHPSPGHGGRPRVATGVPADGPPAVIHLPDLVHLALVVPVDVQLALVVPAVVHLLVVHLLSPRLAPAKVD